MTANGTATLPTDSVTTDDYMDALCSLPCGKRLHDAIYVHKSTANRLPDATRRAIDIAVRRAALNDADYDVVKLSLRELRLSLLAYPGFFTEAFPILIASTSVDLAAGTG
jgi:hypothetical protein